MVTKRIKIKIMQQQISQDKSIYIRNIFFGVEDSLVSTVGLLSGIAIAGVPRSTILLTGTVLIFVEAFSMGVGSMLSEHSAKEYIKQGEVPIYSLWSSGFLMFISYLLAGLIPLLPYGFLEISAAWWVSIVLSLAALFALGGVGARLAKTPIFMHGMEMLVLGGAAIFIGIGVGTIIERFIK